MSYNTQKRFYSCPNTSDAGYAELDRLLQHTQAAKFMLNPVYESPESWALNKQEQSKFLEDIVRRPFVLSDAQFSNLAGGDSDDNDVLHNVRHNELIRNIEDQKILLNEKNSEITRLTESLRCLRNEYDDLFSDAPSQPSTSRAGAGNRNKNENMIAENSELRQQIDELQSEVSQLREEQRMMTNAVAAETAVRDELKEQLTYESPIHVAPDDSGHEREKPEVCADVSITTEHDELKELQNSSLHIRPSDQLYFDVNVHEVKQEYVDELSYEPSHQFTPNDHFSAEQNDQNAEQEEHTLKHIDLTTADGDQLEEQPHSNTPDHQLPVIDSGLENQQDDQDAAEWHELELRKNYDNLHREYMAVHEQLQALEQIVDQNAQVIASHEAEKAALHAELLKKDELLASAMKHVDFVECLQNEYHDLDEKCDSAISHTDDDVAITIDLLPDMATAVQIGFDLLNEGACISSGLRDEIDELRGQMRYMRNQSMELIDAPAEKEIEQLRQKITSMEKVIRVKNSEIQVFNTSMERVHQVAEEENRKIEMLEVKIKLLGEEIVAKDAEIQKLDEMRVLHMADQLRIEIRASIESIEASLQSTQHIEEGDISNEQIASTDHESATVLDMPIMNEEGAEEHLMANDTVDPVDSNQPSTHRIEEERISDEETETLDSELAPSSANSIVEKEEIMETTQSSSRRIEDEELAPSSVKVDHTDGVTETDASADISKSTVKPAFVPASPSTLDNDLPVSALPQTTASTATSILPSVSAFLPSPHDRKPVVSKQIADDLVKRKTIEDEMKSMVSDWVVSPTTSRIHHIAPSSAETARVTTDHGSTPHSGVNSSATSKIVMDQLKMLIEELVQNVEREAAVKYCKQTKMLNGLSDDKVQKNALNKKISVEHISNVRSKIKSIIGQIINSEIKSNVSASAQLTPKSSSTMMNVSRPCTIYFLYFGWHHCLLEYIYEHLNSTGKP